MGITARKRSLYAVESLAIMLLSILGLYPSGFTLMALLSFPGLVLALVGVFRPAYFDPVGVGDHRGWYRLYMHACAAVCGTTVVVFIVNVALFSTRVRR